jgi:hypothetical protein
MSPFLLFIELRNLLCRWEEGDRIGVTGGLADPLTAVIKTTKLGLGASR